MHDAERFRLHGPYHAPRSRLGRRLTCEVRGEVVVCGFTEDRIPWPVGKRGPRAGARFLIVTGGLAEAVRRESAIAVSYWWGVGRDCVTTWRQALGVPLSNEGTHQLRHDYAEEPGVRQGLVKAWAKAQDPERRAKIGAAHRGKRLSARARRKLSRERRGRPLSAATRRKIAEAHRGRLPSWVTNPWTAAQDDLVRTLPPAAVAKRTGRTLQAVYARRTKLGVAQERGYNGSPSQG
jgi:hypothetical protein